MHPLTNHFLLQDSLMALFIILLSISMIFSALPLLDMKDKELIENKIEKKWFYSD